MTADGVTWWGHATVGLTVAGVRFLTDPALRPRIAHLTRRVPAVSPAQIGPLDAVLLSHIHRDHLDTASLAALNPAVPLVVPRGAADLVPEGRVIHELAEGESIDIGGVTVTATHAVHEASRGGRSVPALGYLLDERIYFAGDTDRFDTMADLAPLDLALLPVWGWGPNLGPGHLDPARAAETLPLLRPRVVVPIHWGTYFPFPLGLHGHSLLTTPPEDFAARASVVAPEVRVEQLRPGMSLTL